MKEKFLFRYKNLDFYQIDKSTVVHRYNDDKYHDSYERENVSLDIKYLTNEGFFDNIGEIHKDLEFGNIRTFSIVSK